MRLGFVSMFFAGFLWVKFCVGLWLWFGDGFFRDLGDHSWLYAAAITFSFSRLLLLSVLSCARAYSVYPTEEKKRDFEWCCCTIAVLFFLETLLWNVTSCIDWKGRWKGEHRIWYVDWMLCALFSIPFTLHLLTSYMESPTFEIAPNENEWKENSSPI